MFVWLAGFIVSIVAVFFVELAAQPVRPAVVLLKKGAWLALATAALLVFSFFVLLTARPIFSTMLTIAFFLLLVMVNNVKYKSLNEPFIFQDYDYFVDAIRHPRLFIPFLGVGKFFVILVSSFLLISLGFILEHPRASRFIFICFILFLLIFLLLMSIKKNSALSFNPVADVFQHGFIPLLFYYSYALRKSVDVESPFVKENFNKNDEDEKPHLIAVQSESFFDPEEIWLDIADRIKALKSDVFLEASRYGAIKVPAWGANTVRSEFSFLSGIAPEKLLSHQFNPYRAVGRQIDTGSIAWYLKDLGYHTVCIHPYHKVFYDRDRVMSKLGFDQFYDLSYFSSSLKDGAYVSDLALVSFVDEIVSQSQKPVFLFVITMENHGPLHLDSVEEARVKELYERFPPAGADEFTKYLHHYEHALQMASRLKKLLTQQKRAGALCWYGDHVPIMPSAYQLLGQPKGDTPFFLFHTQGKTVTGKAPKRLHQLGTDFLKVAGLK